MTFGQTWFVILLAIYIFSWLMYWLWSRKESLRERRAQATKGYREVERLVEADNYRKQFGLNRWEAK